jgi:hypothetical protein
MYDKRNDIIRNEISRRFAGKHPITGSALLGNKNYIKHFKNYQYEFVWHVFIYISIKILTTRILIFHARSFTLNNSTKSLYQSFV